jgi:hypothetical protein
LRLEKIVAAAKMWGCRTRGGRSRARPVGPPGCSYLLGLNLAVHSSRIEPLPHGRAYIEELNVRGDLERCFDLTLDTVSRERSLRQCIMKDV